MEKESSNLKYIQFLLVGVTLVIVVSLSARILLSVKNSHFKANSYNIILSCKETYIVGVDKKNKRSSVVSVGNLKEKLRGKGNLEVSVLVHVPITGQLVYRNTDDCPLINQDYFTYKNLYYLLTNNKIAYKNINRYDVFKLFSIAKNVHKDNSTFRILKLDSEELDSQLVSLYGDEVIHNGAVTIQIVNATSIDGLGSRIGTFLTNGGYNVIGLKSDSPDSQKTKTSKIVVSDSLEKKYIQTLQEVMGFPVVYNNSDALSDITIYVGADTQSKFSE